MFFTTFSLLSIADSDQLGTMNYPIPPRTSESIPQKPEAVTEELILQAIFLVIQTARSQGQSLDEVKAEVLADDMLLDAQQRRRLSDIVAQAWDSLPDSP